MKHLVLDLGIHQEVSAEEADALVERGVVHRCASHHPDAPNVYHMHGTSVFRNIFTLNAALAELRRPAGRVA